MLPIRPMGLSLRDSSKWLIISQINSKMKEREIDQTYEISVGVSRMTKKEYILNGVRINMQIFSMK